MSSNVAALNAPATPAASTYIIKGGKVGVLLIHGLCGTPAEVRYVAMGLARAGYTVHCPTLAGHGGNRGEDTQTGWKDWLRSAEEALDVLRQSCDTVIVGGLCAGSLIGLHLAANHPEKVQAVALFSPTFRINGWAMPWYTKLFSLVRFKAVAKLMHFPDAPSLGIKCPRVREFVRTAISSSEGSEMGTCGTPASMVLEHRWLAKAAKAVMKKVKQPTLVVHSREDDYAALDNATFVQREMTGEVEMVVLDDSYHMVTLDKQRHVVVERTASFIARTVDAIGSALSPSRIASFAGAA
ncbi:MAG: alpha/beta hydrolase [Hyphomicrobiaceae bacterium]